MTLSDFAMLSWRLLEYRAMYYLPERVHVSRHAALTVPDAEYDALERRYEEMAAALCVSPTITNMVDFDDSRPSGKLVLKKLASPQKA